MAWYYGTFSCGHEGRVGIIGPMKDRQWKADRKFEGLCEECYKAKLEKDREEANKKALEAAKEMELPELIGTEKQIAWANTLRNKRLEQISSLREKINYHIRMEMIDTIESLNIPKKGCKTNEDMANRINQYLDKAEEYLISNTKASYWIDSRLDRLNNIFMSIADKINVNETDVIIENELISDTTISPETVEHNGIVEITATESKIDVKFDKNEVFRSIVKSLGYKWENRSWIREINETNGNYIDRAAELGNKLLNAGFAISIKDEEIKTKAINGNYEQECTRWIYHRANTSKLAIKWDGINDKLYNAAKKIQGARWNNSSMLVDVSNYLCVEEFADMYGFKFTRSALELIEKYKIELDNVTKVKPKVVNEKQEIDKLEDILNSSHEILDDLKEAE